jgi:hypothetical protein
MYRQMKKNKRKHKIEGHVQAKEKEQKKTIKPRKCTDKRKRTKEHTKSKDMYRQMKKNKRAH